MAKFRFKGDGDVDEFGAPKPCLAFGQEFPVGEWIKPKGLTDAQLSKLTANPTFDNDAKPDAPAPVTAPVAQPAPVETPEPETAP